ncbi:RDD family protein [Nocardioides currus]|uniref:RDD domain-containing protein n=1 Tax=Nocardioides currus TaxID=2133958 RepID=A0A2R7YY80_9ACTN|nr:RDD family protein [Nocardioides currus]PUA81332.1 hypothetical protein C7S10_09950 [Nocardioides currus]
MSNYGNPPTDPYGQSGQPGQDPYGQQPGQPTNDPYAQQQNPYGAQSYGYPSNPGVPPGVTFAHWGKRVAAYLIDALGGLIAYIPGIIGIVIAGASAETDPYTGEVTSTGGSGPIVAILMFLSVILVIAYFVWNFFIKQGRTGYTIGKGVMGIKLVKAETGQPIGPGMAFVRQLAHILDGIPCNLGYLWPLWDANRQTFADKVIGTYVIDQPKP